MGKKTIKDCWAAWGLSLLVLACGSSEKKNQSRDCVPGERFCDESSVKECGKDRTLTTVETCAGECAAGACVEKACLPGSRHCEGKRIFECDSTGESRAAETCSDYCQERDDDARCSTMACTPGEATCAGDVVTDCKSDGSGPEKGGLDCAESAQVCYRGACRSRICDDGKKTCIHDDVYLCAENGTVKVMLADCGPGEVCDEAKPICRAKTCDPDAKRCDGTRPSQCNAAGTAWESAGDDCAATDERCVDGRCEPRECEPYSIYCKDNTIYRCDAAGAGVFDRACTDGSRCKIYENAFATCFVDECAAGATICHNNFIKTCTAEATIPDEGVDCGDEQYCDAGECKPRACEADGKRCQGADLYECDVYGNPHEPIDHCTGDLVCSIAEGKCAPALCDAGSLGCLDNQVGTCAEGGMSLASVTKDCKGDGKVCDAALACAANATDVIGAASSAQAESFEEGLVLGDIVSLGSRRKLVGLEMSLVLATSRQLRWLVFARGAEDWEYNTVYQKTTSNQTGVGQFSSGPLDYTLEAGKLYVLGVEISGGGAVSYVQAQPFGAPSFGAVRGRVVGQATDGRLDNFSTEPDLAFQMRVATTLP